MSKHRASETLRSHFASRFSRLAPATSCISVSVSSEPRSPFDRCQPLAPPRFPHRSVPSSTHTVTSVGSTTGRLTPDPTQPFHSRPLHPTRPAHPRLTAHHPPSRPTPPTLGPLASNLFLPCPGCLHHRLRGRAGRQRRRQSGQILLCKQILLFALRYVRRVSVQVASSLSASLCLQALEYADDNAAAVTFSNEAGRGDITHVQCVSFSRGASRHTSVGTRPASSAHSGTDPCALRVSCAPHHTSVGAAALYRTVFLQELRVLRGVQGAAGGRREARVHLGGAARQHAQ